MKVSRRDFLKISAGAGVAATFMNTDIVKQAMGVILQNEYDVNLVWVHGQCCSGCTISALQWCGAVPDSSGGTVYRTNLIKVLQNTGLFGPDNTDLEFHPTLMPQAGAYYSSDGVTYDPYNGLVTAGDTNLAGAADSNQDEYYVDAIEYLKAVVDDTNQTTIVIVEGSIPYDKWGDNEEQGFCEIGMEDLGGGTYREGHMWMISDIVKYCQDSSGVAAFVAYGNCGAFGGIPGGNPNPTGAKGLQHFLEDQYGVGGHKPVININDCPAHPEHLILTYSAVLASLQNTGGLLNYVKLDRWNRPTAITLDNVNWYNLFGKPVHDECERKPAFDKGQYATTFDDAIKNPDKCLLRLGCRGVDTFTNCSYKGSFSQSAATSGWNPDGVGIWNADRDVGYTTVNPGGWCVAAGSPCYGCGTTTFPDNVLGSSFFIESAHSEMLASGKIPGEASGATGSDPEDYTAKGVACYTCHAANMPRKSKEWIK